MEAGAFAQVMHQAFEVHFESEARSGVGTVWAQHTEDPEDPVISRHRVVVVESGRSIVMTSEDKRFVEEFVFEFSDSAGGGTEVKCTMTVKNRGGLAVLLAFGFKPVMQKMMLADRNRVREHLERG